ncbi:aquaporin [Coniophora puteana RWD-64-598 SS2]|uniref:Aquaporin n=1 Tax=Coniophora puteana (strain RWD-64-598) TaxID=741705 RepID=A0A5M3MG24_CONPW|nr:aquaporin [Coniophora puteana RWD-64-598 SS2]EIW78198.1 aquaporin [Coniophora puteana RWD-64-598 SS2]
MCIREPAAEFLGTMTLVLFGVGGICQVGLSSSASDFLSINFGIAIGVAVGVWIAGGISGGHINPAVTVALATLRRFPWKKVPIYCVAQLAGAFCGAGIVYANYRDAINAFEGGPAIRTVAKTGSLFATYAADYMSNVGCFFSEFLPSALLMIGILAFIDKRNNAVPPGLLPLALFLIFIGIGLAMGLNTGYAVNPARDLGPRLFTAMVGYGKEVFTFRNQYWLWCPVIAPMVGCIAGGVVYDALIYTGSDSVINTPDATVREQHTHTCAAMRDKLATGVDMV